MKWLEKLVEQLKKKRIEGMWRSFSTMHLDKRSDEYRRWIADQVDATQRKKKKYKRS